MNHTPGPWIFTNTEITAKDGDLFVAKVTDFRNSTGRQAANGRLIAAAPELLEALQWLLNDPDSERGSHTAITYAQDIIAKATKK